MWDKSSASCWVATLINDPKIVCVSGWKVHACVCVCVHMCEVHYFRHNSHELFEAQGFSLLRLCSDNIFYIH